MTIESASWCGLPFAGVNRCFSKYDLQVKTACIVEVVYMHFVNTEETTWTIELALYYACYPLTVIPLLDVVPRGQLC